MDPYKPFIAVALIITSMTVHLSHAQRGEGVGESRPTSTVYLEDYLLKLGEQYDVYFTVETAWQAGEHMNWMEHYNVRQFSTEEGIQQHLKNSQRNCPSFHLRLRFYEP